MRWQQLFDDLEGQLEQELGAEEVDLRAEEERLRLGRLALRDRLKPLVEARATIDLALRDGRRLTLTAGAMGRDWLAGETETAPRGSVVIPIGAVRSVLPTPEQLAATLRAEPVPEPPTALSARLGLSFVLRDLCRRRSAVEVWLTGEALHGTIDRVGRDHLDVAEHAAGEPRRRGSIARIRLVPFDAVDLVRF